MSKVVSESGAQLVARISSELRPRLEFLSSEIFPDNGPDSGQIIDISGDTNTGKSHVLMEIMARVILPSQFGGRDGQVVFFNLDNRFRMNRFLHILEKVACASNPAEPVTKKMLENSLANLLVYNCYSVENFELAQMDLEDVLMDNSRIALITFDSIFSFYWLECKENGSVKMEIYFKRILTTLRRLGREYKITSIFTRQSCYTIKPGKQPHGSSDGVDAADYKITLEVLDAEAGVRGFEAKIEVGGQCYSRYFTIDNFGIHFFKSS